MKADGDKIKLINGIDHLADDNLPGDREGDRDWLSEALDAIGSKRDANRCNRAPSAIRTAPRTGSPEAPPRAFKVVTWNLWYTKHQWQARLKAALRETLQHDPDVICYQEVTADVHGCMSRSRYFRARYEPTEERLPHGDDVAIWVRKSARDLSFRWDLAAINQSALRNSGSGRSALCLDLEVGATQSTGAAVPSRGAGGEPSTLTYRIRVVNAHLESGGGNTAIRMAQLDAIFDHERRTALADPAGPGASLVVGDFNFDPSRRENQFLEANGTDVWGSLRPGEAGFTEDTLVNEMRCRMYGRHKRARFDRAVLVPSADDGAVRPLNIDLLGTSPVEGREGLWPSDHFGLVVEIEVEPVGDAAMPGPKLRARSPDGLDVPGLDWV